MVCWDKDTERYEARIGSNIDDHDVDWGEHFLAESLAEVRLSINNDVKKVTCEFEADMHLNFRRSCAGTGYPCTGG